MNRTPFFVVLLGVAAACSSSDRGAEVATAPPTSDPTTAPTSDPMNGQTGSIGQCECGSDAQCAAQAEQQLGDLRMPRHLDRRLIGSECAVRDASTFFAHPTACYCYYGWNGSQERMRVNAQILGNKPGCDVDGRGVGSCLASCREFTGCDPHDGASCDARCAELDAKISADEAKTFDVVIRSATCTKPSCRCQTVFRFENSCYATASIVPKAYDCALSDDAILADANAPPAPNDGTAVELDPNAPNLCE